MADLVGAAEDVVAVLDLQLLQIVFDDAQEQPEVRHGEVVLALQVHKVALVCTGMQPRSAGVPAQIHAPMHVAHTLERRKS